MSSEQDKTDAISPSELDALFDDLAQTQVEPSAEFMARITADMEANLPPVGLAAPKPARPAEPWWRAVLNQIGGAPAAAGLAMAGVAGLAIGTVDPASLDSAAALLGLEVMAYDVDDLFTSFPVFSEDG